MKGPPPSREADPLRWFTSSSASSLRPLSCRMNLTKYYQWRIPSPTWRPKRRCQCWNTTCHTRLWGVGDQRDLDCAFEHTAAASGHHLSLQLERRMNV
jgi:hypothetical protein